MQSNFHFDKRNCLIFLKVDETPENLAELSVVWHGSIAQTVDFLAKSIQLVLLLKQDLADARHLVALPVLLEVAHFVFEVVLGLLRIHQVQHLVAIAYVNHEVAHAFEIVSGSSSQLHKSVEALILIVEVEDAVHS